MDKRERDWGGGLTGTTALIKCQGVDAFCHLFPRHSEAAGRVGCSRGSSSVACPWHPPECSPAGLAFPYLPEVRTSTHDNGREHSLTFTSRGYSLGAGT